MSRIKLPFYTQTAGLGQYHKADRLRVYRRAHRDLLQADRGYRTRMRLFVLAVVGLSLSPIMVHALDIANLLSAYWLALIWTALTILILTIAVRQQIYMNNRIGRMLCGINGPGTARPEA